MADSPQFFLLATSTERAVGLLNTVELHKKVTRSARDDKPETLKIVLETNMVINSLDFIENRYVT